MSRVPPASLYAALLALAVVAYLPVWRNDFVDFDDETYITANPRVLDGLSGPGAAWALTTDLGHYLMPVSWLSLQFDAHFFSARAPGRLPEPSPAAFHGQNLFWHTASTLLLFGLLRRLTGARWRSFVVAALFAVHPLHVESVAWAAERKDVLSVFFGLLALWAYARYAEAPASGRYLAVVAAYALSLLAKPMLLPLPLVLLLLDYWPLGRVASGQWRVARQEGRPSSLVTSHWPLATLVLEKVPLLLVSAAVGAAALAFRARTDSVITLDVLPVSARLANALAAYGWYVAHTLVPVNLCVLYPHRLRDWSWAPVLAGAGVLLAVTVLAAWQARRRPWLLVGWLWFVLTLLPVSGLAQGGVQAWADRFTYWPHIGLFIALVWGLAELAGRLRVPAWAEASAAALALAGCAALTWVQVGYWHDTAALWQRALAVTEGNHRAHLNLGRQYLYHGRPADAVFHFSEAVRINPRPADHYYNYGIALLTVQRPEEAAVQLREALGRDPTQAEAWYSLGLAEFSLGQTDKAVRCFRRALERDPQAADALAMLGQALWRLGRRAEALEALRQSLAVVPRQPDAWYGLGVAYLAQGRTAEAVEALEQSLAARPEQVKARSELGVALGRTGRWADATTCQWAAVQMQREGEKQLEALGGRMPAPEGVPPLVVYECRLAFALATGGQPRAAAEFYRSAARRDPGWPEKYAAKAWRLATDPDPDLRDAQQAYELAGQAVGGVADPPAALLDAWAVALAARGDFEEATQAGRRALDKATAAGETPLAGGIRGRLQLYHDRKPVPGSCQ